MSDSPSPSSLSGLASAIEHLEYLLAPAVLWPDADFHGYEPFEADLYVEALGAAMQHAKGKRYLEVGCGIGTKLVIARALGLDVTGLELRPLYASIARAICPEAEIIVGDARGFGAYGSFDIVYSYKPCVDEDAQQELERFMSAQMQRAAVWINAKRDTAWLGWQMIAPHTWSR